MSPYLNQIRLDLDAVRGQLQHPSATPGASSEIIGHLEAAVRGLEGWIREFPSAAGNRAAARGDLLNLQDQLRQLQPLFENARKLQAGWYQLAIPEDVSAAVGYDISGAEARGTSPRHGGTIARPGATIDEAG